VQNNSVNSRGLELDADLRISSEDNIINFEKNYFDVVIAWNVLYYNDESSISKILSEIHRVMKHGAFFIATLITPKDCKVSNSKHISGCTFEFISLESNQKGSIIVSAETKEDVKDLFNNFKDIEIGYSELAINERVSSYWIIVCKK